MLIPDSVRSIFAATPEPVLAVAAVIGGQASVVIRCTDGDMTKLRGRIIPKVQYVGGRYASGAIIAIRIEAAGLTVEAWLNPAADADRELLERLRKQAELPLHFFDPRNEYRSTKYVPQHSMTRRELYFLAKKAADHLRLCGRMDWEATQRDYASDVPFSPT